MLILTLMHAIAVLTAHTIMIAIIRPAAIFVHTPTADESLQSGTNAALRLEH
jgi:hypothetical protein